MILRWPSCQLLNTGVLEAEGIVACPTHLRDELMGCSVSRRPVWKFERYQVGIGAQDERGLLTLINNPGIVVVARRRARLVGHPGAVG